MRSTLGNQAMLTSSMYSPLGRRMRSRSLPSSTNPSLSYSRMAPAFVLRTISLQRHRMDERVSANDVAIFGNDVATAFFELPNGAFERSELKLMRTRDQATGHLGRLDLRLPEHRRVF